MASTRTPDPKGARAGGIARAAAAAKAAEGEEDAARRVAVAKMSAPQEAPEAAPAAPPAGELRPPMEIPDKLYFRIGEVAELVGVEAHVLRYWETEFRLRPTRSQSGQRLYRKSDLARFLRVRQLLHEEGYTIAGARKVLLDGAEAPGGLGVERKALEDALKRVRALRAGIAGLVVEVGNS